MGMTLSPVTCQPVWHPILLLNAVIILFYSLFPSRSNGRKSALKQANAYKKPPHARLCCGAVYLVKQTELATKTQLSNQVLVSSFIPLADIIKVVTTLTNHF